jgi:DNA-binding NarL/FixJ family response regulator
MKDNEHVFMGTSGRNNRMPVKHWKNVDTVLLSALLAFTFYSIVNIYQSPLSIGDTTLQSTILSLSKSLTALAFALFVLMRGIRFKYLLSLWVASVLLFSLVSAVAWLTPNPPIDYLYYLTLGIATSLGLVTLATLFSDFPWQQARWILLIRHFLARTVMLVLMLVIVVNSKAIILVSYILFAFTLMFLVFLVIQKARLSKAAALFIDYDIPRPLLSGSLNHRHLPHVKMAFALGGAALSPFILGLFESVAKIHGFAYSYTPLASFIITLITTLTFLIAFLLKKEIDIDMAFLITSAISIIFIILVLTDSHLSESLYVFLMLNATFYHVALWMFIFKPDAQKTIHPAIAIGLSVCVISLARMGGNVISTIALTNALPDEVLGSIIPLSLAMFALVNFSLFIIILRAKTSPEPHPEPPHQDGSQVLETFCRRHSLTLREAQVLTEYASGRSADAIAKRLYLSTYTVKTYIYRIYRKLNVHSRQELLDLIETENS